MAVIIMILVAVLVFGAVIFIHELGHFVVAKLSGIKVNEFAIGMGPALLKWQKGETLYALRLLPVGGYVQMEGEDEESTHERSFQSVAVYKRVLVTIAGAFMNLVLGFLALVVVTAANPNPISSREVAWVEVDATGLREGDIIEKVNGRSMFIFSDLDYEFARTQNGTFTLEVQRGNQRVTLENVTFGTQTVVDPSTGQPMMNDATGQPYEFLDFGFGIQAREKTVGSVLQEALGTTFSYARVVYLSLFDLIAGRLPINQLSGPVGIVNEIGKAVSLGWLPVINLLALISVNLGVMNMLPLPALDGGRTVLLILEGIRKKPIPQKYEIAVNMAGFALLIGLMVFVSFNDIRRIFFGL